MNLAVWYPAMFVLGVVASACVCSSSMPAKGSEEHALTHRRGIRVSLRLPATALIRPESGSERSVMRSLPISMLVATTLAGDPLSRYLAW